jgi:TonB family protein
LLFKSARNSATNQASLAVAVVEGQAGVAKAFRIGANLVLTKPINVEQAKGTLRVARGLLRKGEAAKPSAGAPIPTTPVPPRVPIAVPAAPARPATLSAANAAKLRPAAPPISKPAASVPATLQGQAAVSAAASAKAATENAGTEPAARSGLSSESAMPINAGSAAFSGGAASAPAPAREAEELVIEEIAPVNSRPAAAPDKTSDTSQKKDEPAPAPPPSFTFGGANLPERSVGSGSTKIFLAIAAVVLVALAGYFGWTQLHGKPSTPAFVPKPASSEPVRTPAPTRPAQVQPPVPSAPVASSPSSQTAPPQSSAADAQPSTNDDASDDSASEKRDAGLAVNSKTSSSASPSSTKTAPSSSKPAAQPDEAAPIVLKNGSVKSSAKSAAADTAAPSMVGLAAAGGSDGSLSNLVGGDHAAKPILQTLNVSQGVSQGLLLKKVQPVYPPNALRMRTEGAVKLLATVGKTGSITTVKVLSGEPLLGQAAMEAVKQWKYKPYLLNGDPVEIQTEVTINFKLPN